MTENAYLFLRAWTVERHAQDEAVMLRMVTVDGEAIDLWLPAEAAADMAQALALAAAHVLPQGPLQS